MLHVIAGENLCVRPFITGQTRRSALTFLITYIFHQSAAAGSGAQAFTLGGTFPHPTLQGRQAFAGVDRFKLASRISGVEYSSSSFGEVESIIQQKGQEIIRLLAQGYLSQRSAEEEKKEFVLGEEPRSSRKKWMFLSRGRGILPSAQQQELAGEGDAVIAERTIAFLRSWFSTVNSPVSLAELDIPAEDVPRIAENALGLAKVWRLNQYSQEVIEEILQRCA